VLFFSVFFVVFWSEKEGTLEIFFFFTLDVRTQKLSLRFVHLCSHELQQGANRIIIITTKTSKNICSRRGVIIGIHRTRFFRRLLA
jgi:hypothetical protein